MLPDRRRNQIIKTIICCCRHCLGVTFFRIDSKSRCNCLGRSGLSNETLPLTRAIAIVVGISRKVKNKIRQAPKSRFGSSNLPTGVFISQDATSSGAILFKIAGEHLCRLLKH